MAYQNNYENFQPRNRKPYQNNFSHRDNRPSRREEIMNEQENYGRVKSEQEANYQRTSTKKPPMPVGNFIRVRKETYDKYLESSTDREAYVGYDNIIMPQRATFGSAGYDIAATKDFTLQPGEYIIIPTFIKCYLRIGTMLMVVPRSGLGFRTHMHLANTVGIIDSDYFHSDADGHIMLKIVNGNETPLEVKRGDFICQGILVKYGFATINNEPETFRTEIRRGGFGSTDNR